MHEVSRGEAVIGDSGGAEPATGTAARANVHLEHVIGDAPAAVLLVDLGSQLVVHANAVAAELAPQLRLPVSVDSWSDSAVLHDLDGSRLSGTRHPLSRLLRREPVAGQAVSALRRSALGESRATLWVVGVPMTGAPGLDDQALVVLLPIRQHAAADALEESLREGVMHQHAVLASGLSFTVADARTEDTPLVWVNPAFTHTTGYAFEDAVGRNCRFLQGPDTSPVTRTRLREAVTERRAVTETILNYRQDGLPFWNQVTMSPVFDGVGELTHFVGVQTDVTGRIEAGRVRDEALRDAREARARAEAAQARLRLLVDTAGKVVDALNPEDMSQRLVDLLAADWADLAVVVHLGETRALADWAVRSSTAEHREAVDVILGALPSGLQEGDPLALILGGDSARLFPSPLTAAGRAEWQAVVRDETLMARIVELGMGTMIVAGLQGRDGASDVLAVGRAGGKAPFGPDDAAMIGELSGRVGLLLDNARLFQSQRRIAETLQRSLLPHLPEVPGLDLASRYVVGQQAAEIGGDFFDVLGRDGSTVLVVGDVAGHDILAAAAMGHLRGMISAVAFDGDRGPAEILEGVDDLLVAHHVETLATAVLVELRPAAGGDWQVAWADAGHLPLIVRHPDGRVELLDAGPGRRTMLGVDEPGPARMPRADDHLVLAAGTLLLGYTDGLVEQPGEHLDVGLARLVAAVREGPDDPDELCEAVLAVRPRCPSPDDVAVVAVRLV